jgi:hypothetical protein
MATLATRGKRSHGKRRDLRWIGLPPGRLGYALEDRRCAAADQSVGQPTLMAPRRLRRARGFA